MTEKQAFSYSTGWIALPATIGGTNPVTLTIAADADFECVSITGAVTQAALTLLTNWAGTVQINNSALGLDFFNVPIPFDCIMGNGRQPYYFTPSKMLPAQSSLNINFVNSVATATNVCIVFHGNKIKKV